MQKILQELDEILEADDLEIGTVYLFNDGSGPANFHTEVFLGIEHHHLKFTNNVELVEEVFTNSSAIRLYEINEEHPEFLL